MFLQIFFEPSLLNFSGMTVIDTRYHQAKPGTRVTVHAPGTVANLVCGFDVLGLCLDDPYDVMELELIKEPVVRIHSGNGFALPTDPTRNTAGAPLLEMLAELDPPIGFDLTIHKQIKPGSGVGSSAASAAGAVVAANVALGNIFSPVDLIRFAMFGEKVATGVKHADNIAPAVFGGITLIRSIHPLDIIPLASPDLWVTVVHPQIEVKTSDARQILRREVLLKDAIKQWGNIAGLVAGILQQDHALIGRSLEDVIIEPIRSILIPGFDAVKAGAKAAGALGGGISGSGPSMFMLSESYAIAREVERAMCAVYTQMSLAHHSFVSRINATGVRVVAEHSSSSN